MVALKELVLKLEKPTRVVKKHKWNNAVKASIGFRGIFLYSCEPECVGF